MGGFNAWLPLEPHKDSFFGIDRTVEPVRLSGKSLLKKKSIISRFKHAIKCFVDGWNAAT